MRLNLKISKDHKVYCKSITLSSSEGSNPQSHNLQLDVLSCCSVDALVTVYSDFKIHSSCDTLAIEYNKTRETKERIAVAVSST